MASSQPPWLVGLFAKSLPPARVQCVPFVFSCEPKSTHTIRVRVRIPLTFHASRPSHANRAAHKYTQLALMATQCVTKLLYIGILLHNIELGQQMHMLAGARARVSNLESRAKDGREANSAPIWPTTRWCLASSVNLHYLSTPCSSDVVLRWVSRMVVRVTAAYYYVATFLKHNIPINWVTCRDEAPDAPNDDANNNNGNVNKTPTIHEAARARMLHNNTESGVVVVVDVINAHSACVRVKSRNCELWGLIVAKGDNKIKWRRMSAPFLPAVERHEFQQTSKSTWTRLSKPNCPLCCCCSRPTNQPTRNDSTPLHLQLEG